LMTWVLDTWDPWDHAIWDPEACPCTVDPCKDPCTQGRCIHTWADLWDLEDTCKEGLWAQDPCREVPCMEDLWDLVALWVQEDQCMDICKVDQWDPEAQWAQEDIWDKVDPCTEVPCIIDQWDLVGLWALEALWEARCRWEGLCLVPVEPPWVLVA
jgi:hypothetical protein